MKLAYCFLFQSFLIHAYPLLKECDHDPIEGECDNYDFPSIHLCDKIGP